MDSLRRSNSSMSSVRGSVRSMTLTVPDFECRYRLVDMNTRSTSGSASSDTSLAMLASAWESRGSRGTAMVVSPNSVAAATGAPVHFTRSSYLQRLGLKGHSERHDLNRLAPALLRDGATGPGVITRLPGQAQAPVCVGGVDINRKPRAHVKRRVRLAQVDRPGAADEPEHRRRLWH